RATPGRAPTEADIDCLSVGGMAVGIDPTERYQRGTYDLRPGDVFLAYTDGVTDTLNFEGQKFGKQRLREVVLGVLAQDPAAGAAGIGDQGFWGLRRCSGILERPDDETLVGVRGR